MKTFRYKGAQARYLYLLLFAAACLLPVALAIAVRGADVDPWGSLAYALLGIVLILVSVYRLRERAVVSDSWVRFIKDWPVTIRFTDIQNIDMMRGEMGFAIERAGGTAVSHTIGKRADEADVETLRALLAMIVERSRLANPAVRVGEHAAAFIDDTSDYAKQRADENRAERATLRGLGGWPAALAAYLFLGSAIHLLDTYDLVAALITSPDALPLIGTIRGVAGLASLALAAWTLIAFFQRKKSFQRDFLIYYAVTSVAALLAYCATRFLATGTVELEYAAVAAMNAVVYLIRLIALRAYMRKSLRVQNTFTRD